MASLIGSSTLLLQHFEHHVDQEQDKFKNQKQPNQPTNTNRLLIVTDNKYKLTTNRYGQEIQTANKYKQTTNINSQQIHTANKYKQTTNRNIATGETSPASLLFTSLTIITSFV